MGPISGGIVLLIVGILISALTTLNALGGALETIGVILIIVGVVLMILGRRSNL